MRQSEIDHRNAMADVRIGTHTQPGSFERINRLRQQHDLKEMSPKEYEQFAASYRPRILI